MGCRYVRHKGMEHLRAYMLKHGPKTNGEWAAFFGISRPHLVGILNNTAQPSKKLMERIAVVTDGEVPVMAWFAPEVRGAA